MINILILAMITIITMILIVDVLPALMATSPTAAVAACSAAVQANLLRHHSLLRRAAPPQLVLVLLHTCPPPCSLVKGWGLNPEEWLPLGSLVCIPGLYWTQASVCGHMMIMMIMMIQVDMPFRKCADVADIKSKNSVYAVQQLSERLQLIRKIEDKLWYLDLFFFLNDIFQGDRRRN